MILCLQSYDNAIAAAECGYPNWKADVVAALGVALRMEGKYLNADFTWANEALNEVKEHVRGLAELEQKILYLLHDLDTEDVDDMHHILESEFALDDPIITFMDVLVEWADLRDGEDDT
jgi:hypothetical protein